MAMYYDYRGRLQPSASPREKRRMEKLNKYMRQHKKCLERACPFLALRWRLKWAWELAKLRYEFARKGE